MVIYYCSIMNVVKSSSVAVKLHPQLLFFFGCFVSEILKVLAILEVKVCQKVGERIRICIVFNEI